MLVSLQAYCKTPYFRLTSVEIFKSQPRPSFVFIPFSTFTAIPILGSTYRHKLNKIKEIMQRSTLSSYMHKKQHAELIVAYLATN